MYNNFSSAPIAPEMCSPQPPFNPSAPAQESTHDVRQPEIHIHNISNSNPVPQQQPVIINVPPPQENHIHVHVSAPTPPPPPQQINVIHNHTYVQPQQQQIHPSPTPIHRQFHRPNFLSSFPYVQLGTTQQTRNLILGPDLPDLANDAELRRKFVRKIYLYLTVTTMLSIVGSSSIHLFPIGQQWWDTSNEQIKSGVISCGTVGLVLVIFCSIYKKWMEKKILKWTLLLYLSLTTSLVIAFNVIDSRKFFPALSCLVPLFSGAGASFLFTFQSRLEFNVIWGTVVNVLTGFGAFSALMSINPDKDSTDEKLMQENYSFLAFAIFLSIYFLIVIRHNMVLSFDRNTCFGFFNRILKSSTQWSLAIVQLYLWFILGLVGSGVVVILVIVLFIRDLLKRN